MTASQRADVAIYSIERPRDAESFRVGGGVPGFAFAAQPEQLPILAIFQLAKRARAAEARLARSGRESFLECTALRIERVEVHRRVVGALIGQAAATLAAQIIRVASLVVDTKIRSSTPQGSLGP